MSSMPESVGMGPRYPCPVCLGVQMTTLRPDPKLDLELDHCERCGGIWFDEGEASRLREISAQAVATRVTIGEKAWVMPCHSCHAPMHRNLAACPACGWKNVLLCPVCERPLEPVLREGLKLDICRRCHGVWFDNVELAAIWNRSVSALARRRGARASERAVPDYFFLDAFFWPMMIPFPTASVGPAPPVDVAGDIPEVGGEAGSIGDVAGGIVDGAGEAAGGVFGWVADFFEGFDFDF